jgi:signal transduction histidine kinase
MQSHPTRSSLISSAAYHVSKITRCGGVVLMAPDEFRSPLHGILASAEFLRDSHLDASQIEFISTIQNCSGTLLDTINHVLDYSKINSFEKTANHQGKSRHHIPLGIIID